MKNFVCIKLRSQYFKIVMVCLLFCTIDVYAKPENQDIRMDILLKNATLKELISDIQRQTDYSFVYSDKILGSIIPQDYDLKSKSIPEILTECLSGTGLSFSISDKTIVLKKEIKEKSESKFIVLKGKVFDKQKNPLPGVTILVKGTTLGGATSVDGSYTLELPKDKITLVFSFIGMKSKEVIYRGESELNVILEDDVAEMDEVVVTGIFERKKEGFTGSAVTVKGEEIKQFSTTSVAKALAAIDPSFRIMDDLAAGSDPNRLPDLRMRGQANLPGSSDLKQLQGEYATYPNQPLLIMDGFEINLQTMVDLDPDRVGSITLLKDAAATAIYGSKAANGVIVIETKVPETGALIISYGGNVRLQTPDLRSYNLMDAREKLQAEKLAGFYPDNDKIDYTLTYNEYMKEVERGVDTYWLSQPLRSAVQQRHSLSLEGGDTALRYKLYAGVNFTPGVMKESQRQTMTGSLDLSYRFKTLRLRNSITVDQAVGDNSPYGSFSAYTKLNPYLRLYGPDGEILKSLQRPMVPNTTNIDILNPIYNTTFENKNRTTDFTVRNLFKIEYDPSEALRLQLDFSLSKSVGKGEMFRPADHTAFTEITDPSKRGDFNLTQSEQFSYSLDATGSYNKTLGGIHYLTANFRMSIQENSSMRYRATVTGFPNPEMANILFGNRFNDKVNGNEGTSRSIGWTGAFGYSYDYRYSFDFNIRMDGSSQFGANNRFAPFWSTGVRWNIMKENFMSDINWLSSLVLRGSYGVTGSQGFAPYQSQSLYSYSDLLKSYQASDGSGVTLVGIANHDLKWQQTDQLNLALESGFFSNRLTLRAEVYRKTTHNTVTDISIAPSLGFSTIPENQGTVRNEGVELALGLVPIRSKDFLWAVMLNGSHNRDKIMKISEALKIMNDKNAGDTKDSPLPRYAEGQSLSTIWVVKSLGIDPTTGDEIFEKRLTGEKTGLWNSVDLAPMGNTEPFLQGNINSNFNYKGLSVSMNFAYKFGGQAYNQTLISKVENADLRYNADKRVLADRWQKPGDIAQFKKLTGSVDGALTQASSRFIMDERTLRMGSLSVSYRMDSTNTNWLKKYRIRSMTMGLTMEELFYASSIKQERGLDYPFAHQYSFSLNIAF